MGLSLRLGTRGSALALWQAHRVRSRLHDAGHAVELVEIKTTGDGIQDRALAAIGDTALFTRQLDDALLAGRIDLAVHSLKDLPSRLPEGIALVAVSEREDPRDALITKGGLRWTDLPAGATVATCSVRRRAQMLWHRPDLATADIRGNVDTRLQRLADTPAWSATVLAAAGLIRLGRAAVISEWFDPSVMLPAPGQGALGITARTADRAVTAAVRVAVHDPATACCVLAERAVLRALDGGCQAPIATLGTIENGRLELKARVLAPDGAACLEAVDDGQVADEPAAETFGRRLAAQLIDRGALDILAPVREARTTGSAR